MSHQKTVLTKQHKTSSDQTKFVTWKYMKINYVIPYTVSRVVYSDFGCVSELLKYTGQLYAIMH